MNVVYTINTGRYDKIPELRSGVKRPGWEYIVFTDDREFKSNTWDVRYIERSDNPVKQQREIKIRAHKYFPNANIIIYHDANQVQLRPFIPWVEKNFTGGIMIKKHSHRHNIFEEAEIIKSLGLDSAQRVDDQIERYKIIEVPYNSGLWEDGILIRDNSKKVIELCELWWEEVKSGSHRDQISLPYAAWETDIKIQSPKQNFAFQNYFKKIDHSPKADRMLGRKYEVWYSNPFAIDKNIGRAYNEFCSNVPDDAYICIQDGDIAYLHPHFGKQIYDIISGNGAGYALLGAVTNRIGGVHQRYNGEMCENDSISYHMEIAQKLYNEKYDVITPTKQGVAGFLMLFPKSTWLKHKFVENNIAFDTLFDKAILKSGGKIGVMEGLYVWHTYRLGKENPQHYKEHLR